MASQCGKIIIAFGRDAVHHFSYFKERPPLNSGCKLEVDIRGISSF